MKWSWLVGRVRGTEIHLHASLLLLIPYALIVFKPDSIPDALGVLLLISLIFVCVALHEIGHTLAAQAFDIQVSKIVLWPLGGFANLNRRPEKVLSDLTISAAGPLMNLLIFAILAILTMAERLLENHPVIPGLSRFLWQSDIFPFLLSLTLANLSLAVFNLVPVYPLDGGQIARGLLKLVFGEKNADLILLVISLPLALLLAVSGVLIQDIVIVLTGLLLFIAAASLNTRLLNNMSLAGLYFIDRAGYYLKRSDFDSAVREYSRAIQRSPNRAGLYVSRAVAYLNLLECEQALADIERALRIDPNNYIAWALRGELLVLDKQYPAALNAYNRAIQLRPNWAIIYIDRGGLYADLRDPNRALQDFNYAIDLGSGSPVAYVLRSMLRYEMGDLPGAHADADQALRYAPHWMLAFPEVFLNNLEGHLAWALDYYWRAILRMPKAYQVYQGRGDACRANNQPAWAIADYHRAIQLAPRQAELYLARGRAYRQLDYLAEAAADFQRAATLPGKPHISRQARALLTEIQPAQLNPHLSIGAPDGTAARSVQAAPPAGTSEPAPAVDSPAPE